MTKRPLLVFDFDGVIIDGMSEYWWSSKAACIDLIGQHLKSDLLEEEIPEAFRSLRPWIHHGWEMVVIAAEILCPHNQSQLDIKAFSEDYSARIKQTLSSWNWKPTELQHALENVRRNALLSDRKTWISRHRPFPKVIERLSLFEEEGIDWAILTTKSAEFTSELMQCFQLHANHLHGHESGSKVDVLLELASEFSLLGFVEDRLSTLESVIATPKLSFLPCYLASWGYLKPADHISLPHGVHLLNPETLAAPLASWN